MPTKIPAPNSKALGYSKLALKATAGLTDLVEAMHDTIVRSPGILGEAGHGRTGGITGMVYQTIRTVAQLVGTGLEQSLQQLAPVLDASANDGTTSPAHEAVLAALNGVLGDYLAETNNPLAIAMQFRRNGRALSLDAEALTAAIGTPTGKILIYVHGHSMNDLFLSRDDHDHGAALASEFGYTTLYLRYNSGRHISTNGREFADQLERLLENWPVPVEELSILAHSLGGLVSRSAIHYGHLADHRWTQQLRKVVFMGTPHHGAPMERGGNYLTVGLGVSPYSAPIGRLAKIRSACITDMRYGYLLDSDWEGQDRFAHTDPQHQHVPLHDTVEHFFIAASLGKNAGALTETLLGDGMVLVDSALGRHTQTDRCLKVSAENQWIGYGIGHIELIRSRHVYEAIRGFFLRGAPVATTAETSPGDDKPAFL